MKISVERTGGIAALTRVWTVEAGSGNALAQWQEMIEACPWDAVPRTPLAAAREFADAQPDRFSYSIRAGQRRAALPERAVTGPWRVLVESTRAAAEQDSARTGGTGPGATEPAPEAQG